MCIKKFFLFFWLLLSVDLFPQVLNPVKWTSDWKKYSDSVYDLSMRAELEKGWHLYSMRLKVGGIGIPTSVRFKEEEKIYKKIGTLNQIGRLREQILPESDQPIQFFENEIVYKQKIKALSESPFTVEAEVEFQACDEDHCLPPDTHIFSFRIDPANSSDNFLNQNSKSFVKMFSQSSDTHDDIDESMFYKIFFFGLLSGLAAVLMPCIFPMIPLTVSFFTKHGGDKFSNVRKAFIYGLSIIVIYLVLGLFITFLFGASALNELSTNPWLNILFFLLFVLFALSFFGAFDINLPQCWINNVYKRSNLSGLLGIFFMALVLTLVSFSCTGPIIGTLLVETTSEGALWGPMAGMLGFSGGLALPFVLFAVFPGWLRALPRSGGWLNTIRVSFGFIELGLAMKFLSNADLVCQWHVIEREIFLAFWFVIFLLLGFYLLGIFTLSKYDPGQGIGLVRLFFAVLSISFSVYIFPGLFGAPLKLLSGLIPPKTYSESPRGFFFDSVASSSSGIENAEKGPHGIMVFHDDKQGLAYARLQQKPVLLDFTGYACANCRKMEDLVWSDQSVKRLLSDDLVVISLYVDDRQPLPKGVQYFSTVLGKNVTTLGQKWTEFQIKNFKANAQPYYVVVDHDLKSMNIPIGVEYDPDLYLNWLNFGMKKFFSQ